MVTAPTVLVLGAGASSDYGYPTGLDLRRRITELQTAGSLHALISDELPHISSGDIKKACASFEHSRIPSIDEFLNYRHEFLEVGKAAIACRLIQAEERATDDPPVDGNLYDYVWSALRAPRDELSQNRLTIVTFNYDRSLEHHLCTALRSTYNLKNEEVWPLLQQTVKIIHVHGDLGPLNWQDPKSGTQYRTSIKQQVRLRVAVERMRIIHEEIADSFVPAEIEKAMIQATQIFFLGFGYHDLNMERLHIPRDTKASLEGTGVGFTPAECDRIRSKWGVRLDDHKCLMFLRSKEWL